MKKPSIDAIRRFKEQQERKKLEETERKIQEKLTTLGHRAAQGDRKAKTELKIIEKSKDERIRQDNQNNDSNQKSAQTQRDSSKHDKKAPKVVNARSTVKKPLQTETDFDELMRLAATNTNNLRREEVKRPSPPPQRLPSIARKPREPTSNAPIRPPTKQLPPLPAQSSSSSSLTRSKSSASMSSSQVITKPQKVTLPRARPQPPIQQQRMYRPEYLPSSRNYHIRDNYYCDEDDEYEDDDDYEQDGFVVDEDDESEAQDEISKTIKSVFGYDKRRCDLREAELDRQYRQIGKVSTFEDLEREERRASRLAAIEDARALREEEERKRLKRLRKRE